MWLMLLMNQGLMSGAFLKSTRISPKAHCDWINLILPRKKLPLLTFLFVVILAEGYSITTHHLAWTVVCLSLCRNYCLLCKYLTQDEEMIAHFFSCSSCPCLSHHHHHLMPVMISLNQTTIPSEGHERSSSSMQWCNVVRADILAPFFNKQTWTWNMLRVDWGKLKLMPVMPFSLGFLASIIIELV